MAEIKHKGLNCIGYSGLKRILIDICKELIDICKVLCCDGEKGTFAARYLVEKLGVSTHLDAVVFVYNHKSLHSVIICFLTI